VHNSYFFLRALSVELNKTLPGQTLIAAFSQNKDELILEFNKGVNSLFMKASLAQELPCLSFPESFARARRNSIDLFQDVISQKVSTVETITNDRSLLVRFSGGVGLLFKMHGNRSNVILLRDGQPVDLFRKQLTEDLSLNLSALARPIDWSEDYFKRLGGNWNKVYVTLGAPVWEYLEREGWSQANRDQKWKLFHHALQLLNNPSYSIHEDPTSRELKFSLLPVGHELMRFANPAAAVTTFYQQAVARLTFNRARKIALQQHHAAVSGAEGQLQKVSARLQEVANDHHFQQWGDLVMANLHRIETGTASVQLPSFEDPSQIIDIPLKKDLTPQRNAEVFYRKAKNREIEIRKLNEQRQELEKRLVQLHLSGQELEQATNAHQLHQLTGRPNTEAKKSGRSLPFHEFLVDGYAVWVGKNAAANDQMLAEHTHKDDLWLHAKDVAGSHVIVKYKSGQTFPRPVIERAAQLAAHYSKRRTDSLCPVSYTPRKFVRKRKGDPAGMVVVEKESVILVEPRG
jgi:predicted ribosome quality control (RQC) complex YloA/Tae2 family protein